MRATERISERWNYEMGILSSLPFHFHIRETEVTVVKYDWAVGVRLTVTRYIIS